MFQLYQLFFKKGIKVKFFLRVLQRTFLQEMTFELPHFKKRIFHGIEKVHKKKRQILPEGGERKKVVRSGIPTS